jgi:acetyl esterase/lipase
VSTAFLGDIVSLNLDTWQTFNGTNRSYATVFGRYNNPDLSLSANTVEGEGRDPGSSADGVWANTPRFSTIGTFYWAMRVSFGWGNDFWFDAPRPGWSALALERPGAATLTVEVSPLNNPSSITATNTSASQIDLSWSRGVSGAPKDTLIVRSADPNFTAPAHGTAYSAGNSLGGDTVVYRGNGTSFSDTGLSAGTTYHYRLYAENWSYYSSGANASATTTLTPEPTPTPTPAPASVTRNVTYATVGGRALQLDAYRPAGTGPFPSIVLVHGGGFTSGSKGSGYIADLAVAVQAAGYAAFDINYRLQGDLGAGATVSDAMNAAQDDLKRALDFVVANAGTYGVDTNRLGVGGGSAGAITALLTTYGPNRSTVRPRALVDLWGSMYGNESSIRAGDPPLVIIHGTSDPTVSYSYATALNNAAVSAGVPVAFIPLPYSGHTFSISTVVNGQTIQQHVLNFLDQYLR